MQCTREINRLVELAEESRSQTSATWTMRFLLRLGAYLDSAYVQRVDREASMPVEDRLSPNASPMADPSALTSVYDMLAEAPSESVGDAAERALEAFTIIAESMIVSEPRPEHKVFYGKFHDVTRDAVRQTRLAAQEIERGLTKLAPPEIDN